LLSRDALKRLLHNESLTQEQSLLLCLAVDVDEPKSVAAIREIAANAGLTATNKWNVSRTLGRSKGKAIRTTKGWELGRPNGERVVRELAGPDATGTPPPVISKLRTHLPTMKEEATREFVGEAIACFESSLYRAAVVFSWVGAVSALQTHVIDHKLKEFNAEAKRRNAKWKEAENADDLSRMKEKTFLEHLDAISVIGKSVRQELEGCLTRRNGCGHPNSYKLDEHVAASHLAILIMNVFAKF